MPYCAMRVIGSEGKAISALTEWASHNVPRTRDTPEHEPRTKMAAIDGKIPHRPYHAGFMNPQEWPKSVLFLMEAAILLMTFTEA